MKFLFKPVTAFEDITRNFEQLEGKTVLDSTPQNFLQLLTAGTLKLTFGTVSVTNGSSTTFAHGLGKIPVAVAAIPDRQGAAVNPPTIDMNQSPTSTNLTFAATNGTGTTVYKVWWLAIG